MNSAPPPTRFANAEKVTRRVLLQLGLGFFAMVLGTVMSGMLVGTVWQTLQGSTRTWPLVLAQVLSARMWVWLVLPALAYAIARVVALKPLQTAAVAVATGEIFSLTLRLIVGGFEGLYRDKWESLLWLGTGAAGVWLTARAIEKSRQAVAAAQVRASAKAEAMQAEYAHFKKEAERLSESREEPPTAGP